MGYYTFYDCIAFLSKVHFLDIDFIGEHYGIGKGVLALISKIERAILKSWHQAIKGDIFLDVHVGGWGFGMD